MSPVSPKPCNITTAGPCPPTRTKIVALSVLIFSVWKPGGNGRTAAETESTTASAASTPTMSRIDIANKLFNLDSFFFNFAVRYLLASGRALRIDVNGRDFLINVDRIAAFQQDVEARLFCVSNKCGGRIFGVEARSAPNFHLWVELRSMRDVGVTVSSQAWRICRDATHD